MSMNKNKQDKISYEAEADIVRVELSKKDIQYAKEVGPLVVHMSKDHAPVYLEILDATRFLTMLKGLLPKERQAEVADATGAPA